MKELTPELEEAYFDFFDNRAFSDGSPYYPCYCNANDRMNYCRVGEFDLGSVPEDEAPYDCRRKGQVKSIVCFEISPAYRGKGIATQLLERVCADGKTEGYDFVEGYPVEQTRRSELAFTGPMR